jgi:hypothetical protein
MKNWEDPLYDPLIFYDLSRLMELNVENLTALKSSKTLGVGRTGFEPVTSYL